MLHATTCRNHTDWLSTLLTVLLVTLTGLSACRLPANPSQDTDGAPDALPPDMLPARVDGPYPAVANGPLPPADGFRGIWYANQPSHDEYKYKYSGGLATYPQQHAPIAVYAPEARKTFFVFGGRSEDRSSLLHLVSYFDHTTGEVARPRVLLDKGTTDAHDNPTLQIDDEGYLWIFSSSHGTARPSYIHRSTAPYRIDAFEHVRTTNFSYAQPHYLPGQGFVLLHTRYQDGRALHVSRSRDGRTWSDPELLAHMAEGQYQISAQHGDKIGTAFNYHPEGKGLNWRTNLYYMESADGGRTWRTAGGAPLTLPLTDPENPALALEYASRDRLVYLKDMGFTPEGHPVVLFLTSRGYASGPTNDPRTFTVARWDGAAWQTSAVTETDNNYDYASLYIEPDGTWRIIGTTEPGPQRYNTGGEVALWISRDRGRTWNLHRQITRQSEYNHTYPRRPLRAHPQFYALWADGHGREPSESRLYFTDREGSAVWRLPPEMTKDTARPEEIRPD